MGNDASRKFGQYNIIRRLGVGGMAETFEARRQLGGTEQRVCLKRVLPAFCQDPKFNQQFLSEARLAASLRHSNIVGVLDFGSVQGTEYLVLELVDGLDLRALLAATDGLRLDAELVSLIALDLAFALSYAHNVREAGLEGIVHRDISPANVLISVRGEVKLADFGIAKAMTNARATASGVMKGKIAYMAPEQMRGQQVDARSDLFSLGVTLYEALAGERPFQGAHDVEVMTHLLAGERRALAEVASGAPPALVSAIEGLLQMEPRNRVVSAEALVDALGECAPAPAARRRLADLVQRLGGLNAPRPGCDPTDLGPLDTELGAEPDPSVGARAAAASKTDFHSTAPATPAVVQAAQRTAAAMHAATDLPVPESTNPALPKAVAAPPASMAVPEQPPTSNADGTAAVDPSVLPLGPPSDLVVLPMDGARPQRTAALIGVLLLVGVGIAFGLRSNPEPDAAGVNASSTSASVAPRAAAVGGGEAAPPSADPEPTTGASGNGESIENGGHGLLGAAARVASPQHPGIPTAAAPASSDATARHPDPGAVDPSNADGAPGAAAPGRPEVHVTKRRGGSQDRASTTSTVQTRTPGMDAETSPEVRTPTRGMQPGHADEAPSPRRAAQMGSAANSGSARVMLRADPWGSIWVDGRYIGRSPATVVLPVGPHVLGGGVGHIMSTHAMRVTRGPNQRFVVHIEYL